jgi:rare lipoprotein A
MRWNLRLGAFVVALILIAGMLSAIPAAALRTTKDVVFVQHGAASWYGPRFHGRRTASGERFDQNELTAAHRSLPLGARVTVTNLENGRSVDVAINDRGPYVRGRVIDLSKAAARELGMVRDGVVLVRVEATPEQLSFAAGEDSALRSVKSEKTHRSERTS